MIPRIRASARFAAGRVDAVVAKLLDALHLERLENVRRELGLG
jgi:hypothetical protein